MCSMSLYVMQSGESMCQETVCDLSVDCVCDGSGESVRWVRCLCMVDKVTV